MLMIMFMIKGGYVCNERSKFLTEFYTELNND